MWTGFRFSLLHFVCFCLCLNKPIYNRRNNRRLSMKKFGSACSKVMYICSHLVRISKTHCHIVQFLLLTTFSYFLFIFRHIVFVHSRSLCQALCNSTLKRMLDQWMAVFGFSAQWCQTSMCPLQKPNTVCQTHGGISLAVQRQLEHCLGDQ